MVIKSCFYVLVPDSAECAPDPILLRGQSGLSRSGLLQKGWTLSHSKFCLIGRTLVVIKGMWQLRIHIEMEAYLHSCTCFIPCLVTFLNLALNIVHTVFFL